MNKLIMILVLFSTNTFAGAVKTETFKIDTFQEISIICLNGYQFAVFGGYKKGGITQIFREGEWRSGNSNQTPPQPIKCDGKK